MNNISKYQREKIDNHEINQHVIGIKYLFRGFLNKIIVG